MPPADRRRLRRGSTSVSACMRCGTVSRRIFSRAASTFASSRCCSKQTHTARHHPIEGRIHYPFHPRCGETVLILRQFAYRGADLVVIPQPDGTVACIPAWMTHESAAQHKVSGEPNLSLEVLRALRAEADALLRFPATVRQRDLFEADERRTAPTYVQQERLAGLVAALLREIAAALTGRGGRR